jgi:hypothetical protein
MELYDKALDNIDRDTECAYFGNYYLSTMLENQIKDLQALASLEQDDEELSDDELEGVAGGRPTNVPTPPPRTR